MLFYEQCIMAGVSKDDFIANTLRDNILHVRAKENDMKLHAELTRNIEFAVYKSAFRGMSGTAAYKKMKNPSDIRRFPWLGEDSKVTKLTPEQASNFIRKNFSKNENKKEGTGSSE